METHVVVKLKEPVDRKSMRFDEFRDGQFLVAPSTGNLGMKVGESRIWWFSIGRYSSEKCIPCDKIYTLPTSVDMQVTL